MPAQQIASQDRRWPGRSHAPLLTSGNDERSHPKVAVPEEGFRRSASQPGAFIAVLRIKPVACVQTRSEVV